MPSSKRQIGKRQTWIGLLLGLTWLIGGCAPTGPATPTQGAGASAEPAGPRTVHIALQNFGEPKNGIIGYGVSGGFDTLEHYLTFHSSMLVLDPSGNLMPRLAERVPTLQNGDWKTFPDGRMDITWKLKDTKWHDGAPFTSADLVLGLKVMADPDVPTTKATWPRLVDSMETPDTRTLVVHWKEPYFLAGGSGPAATPSPALPNHILGQPYKDLDKPTFINLPYWTDEFVGLGPYRVVNWQRGSWIEGAAYDGYVLGRPKIDRVFMHYVGDVNTIVAGILSGDLDVVAMGARMDVDQMMAIKNIWAASGDGGTVLPIAFGNRAIWLQLRDPTAPWAKDVRVRRAMSHSTDRQAMSEALQNGLAPPTLTFIPQEDSGFKVLESTGGYAQYPYDPNKAHQLLAEAGWNLGADGLLQDATGQPMAVELTATGQGSNVQEIETVASIWKKIGFNTSVRPLPPTSANLDELKNGHKGGFVWPGLSYINPQALISNQIATERTVWKGGNYGGYLNKVYDDLYDKFQTTLDSSDRQKVNADIMRVIADEVPIIPIYFYGNGMVSRKNVEGPGMISPNQTANTWNINEWVMK